jgi:phage terminase small subunit
LLERDGSLPAADGVVVRLFADALARLDLIHEYLGHHGWQDEDGNPRPVLEYEARLRREALECARELGMTPRSRAALGLDVVRAGAAFDLARHWQETDSEASS